MLTRRRITICAAPALIAGVALAVGSVGANASRIEAGAPPPSFWSGTAAGHFKMSFRVETGEGAHHRSTVSNFQFANRCSSSTMIPTSVSIPINAVGSFAFSGPHITLGGRISRDHASGEERFSSHVCESGTLRWHATLME